MLRATNAPQNTPNKVNESSEEDNELGEETISGENDVEYAEFSLSLRTSPKEQISNNNRAATTESADGVSGSNQHSSNSLDEFMSLPVAAFPSTRLCPFNIICFNYGIFNYVNFVFIVVLGKRNRYRNPVTSASVFDTLLEAPATSHNSSSTDSNSSSSGSSSTESIRNGI